MGRYQWIAEFAAVVCGVTGGPERSFADEYFVHANRLRKS